MKLTWWGLPFILLLAGCDSELVSACEAVIKDRLKSPSSYKRVEVRERNSEVELNHYRQLRVMEIANLPSAEERGSQRLALDFELGDMQFGKKPMPKELVASFSYDAANGFGAIIRGHSECTILDTRGKPSMLNVKVDGKTYLDFIADRSRASQ